MGMKRDTYQMWKDTGQLPQVLEFIKECSRKLDTQKEMCTYLNLDEATFTRLKKKHPELDEAFHKAKLDLKKDLMAANLLFLVETDTFLSLSSQSRYSLIKS